jgi:hypothetical protein
MKTVIKSIIMSVAAMFCFAVSVSAQKVSVAIVDQHYATETANYKLLMGLLASAYVAYLVVHNKRRKAAKRYYSGF